MTEAQLDRILYRCRTRTRINAALTSGCVAAGMGLGLGALLIAAARLWPAYGSSMGSVCASIPVLVAVTAAVVYRWTQPSAQALALGLDRSAGLSEHLTTWIDYRQRSEATDALTRSFVQAQRQATLRCTDGLSPARHLPIRLPDWSRALWLGVLVVGCALLMPEQPGRNESTETAFARQKKGGTEGNGSKALQPLAPGEQASAFKVQIIPPTRLFELQLQMMDPRVTPEMKAKMLEELEAKRGTLPESELSDEVRDLLAELRRQSIKPGTEEKLPDGSQVVSGTAAKDPRKTGTANVGAISARTSIEDLVGVARDRFPDLSSALEKYYRAVSGTAP